MEVLFQQICENDELIKEVQDTELVVVLPGQVITKKENYMRGHGTYIQDDNLVASCCGIVEREGKLISVMPLKSRYIPTIGETIIGRIVEVSDGLWKVDINACQLAILRLDSVFTSDGEQRKKTEKDQLSMRDLFVENDLVCVQVLQVHSSGNATLQIKSIDYGKLENGVFMTVPPSLVKHLNNHRIILENGVYVILGSNGYIWITKEIDYGYDRNNIHSIKPLDSVIKSNIAKHGEQVIDTNSRMKITKVYQAIQYLKKHFISISPDTIMKIYKKL